jgi:hypothetical protein
MTGSDQTGYTGRTSEPGGHYHEGSWYTDAECPHPAALLAEVDQAIGQAEAAVGQLAEVAWDRAETDSCERGTPGCSIRHTRDSECQPW